MKECVLVTGGAGYIGTHTSVELLQAGYEVIVVDNLSNSEASMLERVQEITGQAVHFEKVDCCDREALRSVFERYQFRSVIHFAGLKAVGESTQEPLQYYRNNVDSFLTVLELMREYQIPNLVFSSSATVYGQPAELPATEDTPRMQATSPYGNTKQICEAILQDAVQAYGVLRGITLRYFNPIGAHPTGLLGELPRGIPNNLVPFITQTAIGARACLSVFGNDYHTPDGSAVRDYIDIVDLAKAHLSALTRMLSGKQSASYEVFNVGTGRGLSVLELIHVFEQANHLQLNYKITGRRAGDVEQIWSDPTRAHRDLGWQATRSLEETLRAAWKWEQHIHNATK